MKTTKYEDSLFYHIHSTAKYFDELFEQFFKEINIGVTSLEHLALMLIYDLKDCCQRDLARILLKDRANTGRLVLKLENKGLISVKPSIKNNRQVKILTVTAKGKKLIDYSMKLFAPVKEHIEKNFSQEKLENLKNSLAEYRFAVSEVIEMNI